MGTARRTETSTTSNFRRVCLDDRPAVVSGLLLPALVSRRSSATLSNSSEDWMLTRARIHSSVPLFWPGILAYLAWIFFIDQAPIQGGRASDWVRSSRFWVWFVGFFPVSLIKVRWKSCAPGWRCWEPVARLAAGRRTMTRGLTARS